MTLLMTSFAQFKASTVEITDSYSNLSPICRRYLTSNNPQLTDDEEILRVDVELSHYPKKVQVPKSSVQVATSEHPDGDLFCFLLTHHLPGKKKDTHIGYSHNPLRSLFVYNNRLVYNKDTRIAAGNWQLSTVLGSFYLTETCESCCTQWVKGTRGIDSKKRKARQLMMQYNVDCFTTDVPLTTSTAEFIESNAPSHVVEAYRDLVTLPSEPDPELTTTTDNSDHSDEESHHETDIISTETQSDNDDNNKENKPTTIGKINNADNPQHHQMCDHASSIYIMPCNA